MSHRVVAGSLGLAPLAVGFSLLGSIPLAKAQEVVTELPTLQIVGERQSASRRSVSSEELSHYQAADLEDVFASEPDVSVGGGHSVAQKLYVRGIEDTLLNIRIDGAQQVGQTFHHTGRITIEPELLKRADIQAGTSDALAGPGALGGSIRFVTKDPEDLLRPGENLGALTKGTYFSNAEGYKASASVFGRFSEDWSGLLMATHQDQNDYEDGSNDVVYGSGSRQGLGFAKLVGHLSEAQTLRLSYERREDEGERTQRPQWVPSSFNRLYPIDNQRETWNVGYAFAPAHMPLVDVELTTFHTQNHLEQNVIGRWGLYESQAESWGFDARNTSLVGDHQLTYGFDYREDDLTAGPGTDPSEQEQLGRVQGVYVQDYWSLTDRLLFGLGARYDRYRLTDSDGQRFDESDLSPNASLRFQATPALALRAAHTRAFRGPQVRDGFKADSAALAPDLQPEQARTSELGFDYAKRRWTLAGKVYRTEIQDAIADPVPRPAVYLNAGDLESEGVLVEAGYHWDALSVGASYHHNDSTIDGNDLNVYEHNGLGASVGDTWGLNADYQYSASLTFGWLGRFVESIDSLETSVGRIDKPGYGVHDLYVSWLPLADESLNLTLTLKNALDKDYLDHASNEDFEAIEDYEGIIGSAEPGRELRLSAALRF